MKRHTNFVKINSFIRFRIRSSRSSAIKISVEVNSRWITLIIVEGGSKSQFTLLSTFQDRVPDRIIRVNYDQKERKME